MKTIFLSFLVIALAIPAHVYGQANPLLERLNEYEYLVIKEEKSSGEHPKEAIYNKIVAKLKECNLPDPTDRSVLYSTTFDQSKIVTLEYKIYNASQTAGEVTCSFKFVNYDYEIIATHSVKEKFQFLNDKNYLKAVEKCFSFMDGYRYQYKPAEKLASDNSKESNTAATQEAAPPQIIFLQPKATDADLHANTETMKLAGYVDSRSDVVSVKINNEIVQSDKLGNFSVQLQLREGLNKVNIEVRNLQGQSAAKELKIIRTVEAGAIAVSGKSHASEEITYRGSDPFKGTNVANVAKELKAGKYYALFIGIDAYSGAWTPLKNAVNDGRAIENIVKNQYKFDVIKTLYDEQATRVNIIRELEWLVANVKDNDNVMIYYSGHGEFKKELNKGYWVPVDAKTNSTAQFISNSEIQTFLAGIPSKHTLLVSDACFSGDIFRGTVTGIPFENSEKYYAKVYDARSRQAISSGGIEPVMDGGRDGHSVFAYYMIQALTANSAKYFDASQLFSKIKIPVINNSEQSPNFHPIKNTGDEGGNFIFIKK